MAKDINAKREKLIKEIMAEAAADNEDVSYEEAAEMADMEIKAKAMKSNYVVSEDRKPRAKVKRKVDNVKLDMLQTIAAALEAEYNINVEIEKEVNLHFSVDGDNYSIKLTRHRNKEKK